MLRFCGFLITEMVCVLGIYSGTMLHHWKIIDIGIIAAVAAYIAYSAADAAFEIERNGNQWRYWSEVQKETSTEKQPEEEPEIRPEER